VPNPWEGQNVPERVKSTVCFFRAPDEPSTRTSVMCALKCNVLGVTQPLDRSPKKSIKKKKKKKCQKHPNPETSKKHPNLGNVDKFTKNLKKSHKCATIGNDRQRSAPIGTNRHQSAPIGTNRQRSSKKCEKM
jgi:hypothetical protein